MVQSNRSKKKSKSSDKEALAKKLMRKKIFVNTKVMFDEEGQVSVRK